jgi:hypothetical protein
MNLPTTDSFKDPYLASISFRVIFSPLSIGYGMAMALYPVPSLMMKSASPSIEFIQRTLRFRWAMRGYEQVENAAY